MTAAECLEHRWLKELPDVSPPSPVLPSPPVLDPSPPLVLDPPPLLPCVRIPSVSDSPSGQRRALASTLTDDDDESDDTLSLREPAKKCRCDVDLKQQQLQPPVDRPTADDSSDDKENCVSIDKWHSMTTTTPTTTTTSPKLDIVETSTLCSAATCCVTNTLIGGVCIDISVA